NPATLPLLRELLRSRSVSVRAAALRAVARMDPAEAAAAADAMAQDPSEDVRTAVVDALEWTPQALTRFAQLRRDPSMKVRAELARALGRPREATPATKSVHRALEAMLGDSSPVVRAAALASLAASADPDGLRAFLTHWPQAMLETRAALRDEPRSAELRARLVMRLGSSADPAERKAAIVALGALGAAGSAVQIVAALSDPSPAVRIAAIQALAALEDREVRQRIAEMCADPETSVQEAARRSLLQTVG
ncbi:MAG: HEAT repeat domain-containing protein, partial [Myxococcales bacterium]|nr:HEAT repeat domain-containing protein [Myxococcales bacterium]